MKITKKEIKMFGDKKGNIDFVRLLSFRLGKAKSEQNDKYMRQGRFDLMEWL